MPDSHQALINMPPAYIDLQVNGYGGVDYNADDLTADALHLSCQALQRDGVAAILATIITDHPDAMARRLRRVAELRERDDLARSVITGIHIEGPFLNETPGYRGAHPPDAIRPADADIMRLLLDNACGLAKLVTLAPERDPGLAVTRMLAKQGIAISAGHCNTSLDELDAAIDAGLSLFTHLGNGCPMTLPRHDNIIQRVLSRADRLTLMFIADDVHVPFVALGNYLKLAGLDHCIIVTDAMAAAGLGPGRHRLGRWEVDVGPDLAAWAPDRSHLVGSAMTMPQAAANLAAKLHLPDAAIRQLTSENPRRFA